MAEIRELPENTGDLATPGGSLDRTLSYREHLTKTAGKLKNRNNLLIKLAGSTWGASANTLRSSAGLVILQYCNTF